MADGTELSMRCCFRLFLDVVMVIGGREGGDMEGGREEPRCVSEDESRERGKEKCRRNTEEISEATIH